MRESPHAKSRNGQPEPLVLDGLTALGSQGPARHEPGRECPGPARPTGSRGRAGRMLQALGRMVARLRLEAGPATFPR